MVTSPLSGYKLIANGIDYLFGSVAQIRTLFPFDMVRKAGLEPAQP